MSFTTIKNGVDTKLEIIRHDETGYYNITKIANIINNIKSEEKGLARIRANSDNRPKRINAWFSLQTTKSATIFLYT